MKNEIVVMHAFLVSNLNCHPLPFLPFFKLFTLRPCQVDSDYVSKIFSLSVV